MDGPTAITTRSAQAIQEPAVILLVDVIDVPEPRFADTRRGAMSPEPPRRRRIERRLPEATQQGDSVALDTGPFAVGPRRIVDTDPHEPHLADRLRDGTFQRMLSSPHRR